MNTVTLTTKQAVQYIDNCAYSKSFFIAVSPLYSIYMDFLFAFLHCNYNNYYDNCVHCNYNCNSLVLFTCQKTDTNLFPGLR